MGLSRGQRRRAAKRRKSLLGNSPIAVMGQNEVRGSRVGPAGGRVATDVIGTQACNSSDVPGTGGLGARSALLA